MNMERGIRGQEGWKVPSTPERRRLVVDSRNATSHWESPSADIDDVLDADGRQDAEEALREEAIRIAELSSPSVDQAEQVRLDALIARSEQLAKAVSSSSPWKRLGGLFSSDSEYARQKQEIEKLRSEIRAQRDLVRDLSYVIRNQDVDSIVPAMDAVKKKQFWAMEEGASEESLAEIRREQLASEKRLEDGFHQISQALGLAKSERSGRIPKTDEERSTMMESFDRALAFGNKVQKKWAAVGLRLLTAYQKSNPTRKDSQARADSSRAAEFRRTGPMESIDGKRWTRMNTNGSAPVPAVDRRTRRGDVEDAEMSAK